MSDLYDVAVVGATGAVGEAMISILEERDFPVGNLYPLASSRSAGKTIMFKGSSVTVTDLAEFDFSQAQIGLFSAGGSISEKYAPIAAEAGCVVVDNTSHFRRDEDIPLIVPEVNIEALAGYTSRGIIANPNCSTIQMLVALAHLRRRGHRAYQCLYLPGSVRYRQGGYRGVGGADCALAQRAGSGV